MNNLRPFDNDPSAATKLRNFAPKKVFRAAAAGGRYGQVYGNKNGLTSLSDNESCMIKVESRNH